MAGVASLKLVTFDDGKVGRLSDGTIAELDVSSMREYFEQGGGSPNGREPKTASCPSSIAATSGCDSAISEPGALT